MSKKLLGIDLGGTTVKFGILTSEGEVQEKWAIETNTLENGRHIVPNIVESLKHRLEMYGIGMGSPGAVNRENKTVTGAFNLNWAETQEVGSVIEKELGIPFAIDNDANVAALGERWVGAGANNPDVVFVTLGTGVGGGVIADGNLIHGVGGAGGEIGHIIVEAETGVDKVSEYLGLATANISNILNPDSVVIGGGVSAAGEFLRSRVEGYFTRYAFPQVRRTTKVKLAELGNDAGIIGAASLALTIDN